MRDFPFPVSGYSAVPALACLLMLCAPLASADAEPSSDSQENPRWWKPGEPLTWAPPGVLDSLFTQGWQGFKYVVESPRSEGYRKSLIYTESTGGKSALFVEGDLRYISYDQGRSNASRSIVNGHTFFSTSYWRDGLLYFQNGHANWLKHSQRLYHSMETLQMEQYRTAEPPPLLEDAMVFPLDSGCLFLSPGWTESGPEMAAHFLAHSGQDFEWLGAGDAHLLKLVPKVQVVALEDYLVWRSGSSLKVIRKADLMLTEVPSPWSSFIGAEYHVQRSMGAGSLRAWRGNVLFASFGENRVVEEDVDAAVLEATWSPLIDRTVPQPEPIDVAGGSPLSAWGWTIALITFGAFLVLLFDKMAGPSPKPRLVSLKSAEDGALMTLSEESSALLDFAGQTINGDTLDRVLGVDDIASPETRRSRRSRALQLVNAEAQARFGHNLVHRVKSPEDKRVVLYHIALPD